MVVIMASYCCSDHQDLDQFAAGLLKNGVPASVFKNMLYKRLQVNLPMIKALMKLVSCSHEAGELLS